MICRLIINHILLTSGIKKRHKERKMSLVKEDTEEDLGITIKVIILCL